MLNYEDLITAIPENDWPVGQYEQYVLQTLLDILARKVVCNPCRGLAVPCKDMCERRIVFSNGILTYAGEILRVRNLLPAYPGGVIVTTKQPGLMQEDITLGIQKDGSLGLEKISLGGEYTTFTAQKVLRQRYKYPEAMYRTARVFYDLELCMPRSQLLPVVV